MRFARSYHLLEIIVLTVVLACLAACSHVSFTYDDVDGTPDKVDVKFTVTWPEGFAPDGQMPASVTVLMSRIVNEVHYVWDESPDGAGAGDNSGTPDPDSSQADASDPDAPDPDSSQTDAEGGATVEENARVVLVGDYYVIACGFVQGTYTIEGLDMFRSDNGFGMTNLKAAIPVISREDIAARYGNLKDFNPSFDFIEEASPLGLSVVKPSIIPGSGTSVIDFQMKDLTMLLTLRLTVSSASGVDVESIVADLSGVPCEIGLMSGLVTGDKTGKMCFEMEKVSSSGSEAVYEAVIRTAGLFPASSDTLRSGNGILRLALTASSNGVSRVFYAGINLKRDIEKADLMSQSPDKNGYRIACSSAELEISQTLRVSREQIENAGDDSLSGWFEDKDIEIEW